MRNLLILVSAILMLAAFGCGSNPAGSITGPSKTTEANLPATQQQEFDWQDEIIGPPKFIENDSRRNSPRCGVTECHR